MTESRTRLPIKPPTVVAPQPFIERRRRSRRSADRLAHEETRLLARALDVLAAGHDPEARLAGLLALLAETVGARRAAVVADAPERRVAVGLDDALDEPAARALGAWLDAAAPRSRAKRAAAGPAPIAIAHASAAAQPARQSRPGHPGPLEPPAYALLPIPSAGDVALGFEFAAPVDAAELAKRLPPAMARHAAVALALVTEALSTERDLAALRAGESERERFVSNVAHELRTPLTGLAGYLDLILDGRVGDADVEREFLERGRSIVGSMAALVSDLLELSRLESGSIQIERAAFSIAEAIASVASGLLPIAMERGIDLRTELPPRLRAATGDRRRVEQILTNLGANALKFGGDDGGRIEICGRFIGTVALVTVRDEGVGIEPDDRPRIFERFYRMSGHERVTGTGLGLPIARDLARAMGGDLDVASLPGTGSAFVLVLPGPAEVGDGVLAEALVAALAIENDRLRDAALRRAGATAGWSLERATNPGAARPARQVGAGRRPPSSTVSATATQR